MRRLIDTAQRPVSGQSGAVFRIAFGLIGAMVAVRYIGYGWVGELLVDPPRHFAYPGFSWVHPWPEPWMSIHVGVMGLAAIGVALGWRYRISLATFLLLFAYMELIDRTLYINHYYWIALTALVMLFLPLNRVWSLDARGKGWGSKIPSGAVWTLRFQVGFVYVFAGLAKINGDWLAHGEPLATWLGARTDLPLVGPLFSHPEIALALSWAGALFDLTIVGWMLWSKTRPFAYVIAVGFHLATWLLFPTIGVFPLVMTAGLLVFFQPDWPVHVLLRIPRAPTPRLTAPSFTPKSRFVGVVAVAACVYMAAMVVIPLRSFGTSDVLLSGDGYQFGWRVMLTEKAGTVDFVVTDPASGATWIVDEPKGLTPRQAGIMATDPALVRQAAAMVENDLTLDGYGDVEVRADSYIAFNGRPHQRFIDPTIDLTEPHDPRPLVVTAP